MKREIRIFKSFEEQEQYQIEQMRKTTPLQRFQQLSQMQQWTMLFHPGENKTRRIIIQKNGHTQ